MDNRQDRSSRNEEDWESKKKKIFLSYIFTEPLRELKDICIRVLNRIKKPKTMILVLMVLEIVAILKSSRFVAALIFILMIVSYISWEWEDGTFIKRYRDRIYKRPPSMPS